MYVKSHRVPTSASIDTSVRWCVRSSGKLPLLTVGDPGGRAMILAERPLP